jgi:Glycosyltransferase family 87
VTRPRYRNREPVASGRALGRWTSLGTPLQRRALRDGLVVAGLVYLAFRFLVIAPQAGTVGGDAFAYWQLDIERPYAQPNGEIGAFLYPPPLARLFAPAALLSWPQFWFGWTALLVGTCIWLGWRRTLLILAFPPVALELYYGNVNLLIAAAIMLGFRYPAAWSFVLLTKVTPGVGLLWFVVRREWRNLIIALGATAVIVVASVAVDEPLWAQWFEAIRRDSAADLGDLLAIPLWLRLPLATAVVIWGARTDRPWTVAVAAALAMPVLWVATFSVLAAIVAMNRPGLRPTQRAKSV